jgi:DNA-binding CsgD family transcriptional regulator
MKGESLFGIILTTFSGLIAIIALLIIYIKTRKDNLRQILFTCLYANMIWWLALCLEYINPVGDERLSLSVIIRDLLVLSSIFVIRFLFLISFFKLVLGLLDINLTKKSIKVLKVSVSIILIIWFLSLIEVPINGTSKVADNLMLYTDILIFAGISVMSTYMLIRATYIINSIDRKAIIKLSYVFLFLCFFSLIKWIIGNTLGAVSPSLERLMIYIALGIFNCLIIWWSVKFGNQLTNRVAFLEMSDPALLNDFHNKYRLSDREMDVVKLLSEGKSNKEIADTLFVSIETIKDHNYNIFIKTGVRNRTQLANLYLGSKSQPGNPSDLTKPGVK